MNYSLRRVPDVGGEPEPLPVTLDRGSWTRLTPANLFASDPVWTHDGERVVFWERSSAAVYWTASNGTGQPEMLSDGFPTSVIPDGTAVIFNGPNQNTRSMGLNILSLDGDRGADALLSTPANESLGKVAPDGRWIAYRSDESGRNEIYVRPFPNVDEDKRSISTGGGDVPVWARDGRTLFYRNGAAMMAVEIDTDPTFVAGPPKRLFDGSYGRHFDVAADGRFLMVRRDDEETEFPPAQIVVVEHFLEELKRLVPVN